MKNLVTILVLLLVVVVCFTSVSYAKGKKAKTITADVLQIPKAAVPPSIDGMLEDIWLNVTATPCIKVECPLPADSVTHREYNDFAVTFRTMWDADNIYFFITVVDDTIFTGRSDQPWMNDNIELYFDGGNEKATSYDANDLQVHWNYGETPDNHPITSGSLGNWVYMETGSGYTWECAIPNAQLVKSGIPLFPYEADQEIGFEVSVGDEETVSSPQFNLHWWTNNNLTWQQPNTFGTAVLSSKEVQPALVIPYAANKPSIDGLWSDGEGWEAADEISSTKAEGGAEDYPERENATGVIFNDMWYDFLVSSWTMWDENNFYVFIKVIDDTIFTGRSDQPWMNDNIELFFDGGNEKATSYDANDLQVHWNYGETPDNHPITSGSIGNWVYMETEDPHGYLGYNWEIAIPNAELVKGGIPLFPYEADHEIGYEISVGDEETATPPRQKNLHWYTTNALTWQQPNSFGTAVLTQQNAIRNQDNGVVTSYRLEQNYPNPFNPTTQITYSIPKSDRVKLTVYNVLGNQVATLVNETKNAGTYTVPFHAQNIASGIYFYKLETGNTMLAKKMMLIK